MSRLKSKGSILLFIFGFLICTYPIISGIYERQQQHNTINTYAETVNKKDEKVLNDALLKAKEYNSMLFQIQGAYVGNIKDDVLSDEQYEKALNITGQHIMGSIQIPKINVDLPIYHGTSDEVLSIGVGHLKTSSLPVGGNNTHSILTGHRGLPNSKLFTRLDELENGDLFYIDVCGETLAYQVFDIQVILPEELEKIRIDVDQDHVSLVTCTPYGINTHRLVVTGKRVPYKKATRDAIRSNSISLRELLFTVLPFGIVTIVLLREIYRRRKEKMNDKKVPN